MLRISMLASSLLGIALAVTTAPAVMSADAIVSAHERIEISTMPDLAATRGRFLAGPYAAIWKLPAMASARAKIDDLMKTLASERGIDGWAILADATAYREQAFAGASSFDFGFGVRLPKTIAAHWTAMTAKQPADASGAITKDGFSWTHAGEWLMGAKNSPSGVDQITLPAMPPGCDGFTRVDILAIWRALQLPEVVAAAQAVQLSNVDYACTFTPTGSKESMEVPKFHLPLIPVDDAVVSRLPADAILVAAAGLDGKGLAAMLATCAKASPSLERGLRSADADFTRRKQPLIADLLGSISGTAFLAITRGTPFPGVTIAVPASAQLDATLAGLERSFELDPPLDLEAARISAQMIPLPNGVPVILQIRRTATHWMLSTDANAMTALESAPDAASRGLDLVAKATALSAGVKPGAVFYQDNRAFAELMVSSLSMATGAMGAKAKKDPETQQQLDAMRMAITVLSAVAPKLPTTVAAAIDRADGTHVAMDNGAIPALASVLGAGMALPAIAMTRAAARRSASGNNERQIVLCALVWANDNDGKWPTDLATACKENAVPDQIFTSPSDPTIAAPYLYVRPCPEAESSQPVVVEDPSCNQGKGSMVTFGDGHVEYVKGILVWAEAKRLAALAKAQLGGIEPTDWRDFRPEAQVK